MNMPVAGSPTMSILAGMLKLMRPKQWVKNGFVLAPLLFSDQFTQAASIFDSLLATALFCVASSAVYIINDYHDIPYDRLRPEKRNRRPLASGQVPVALVPFMLLFLVGILVWGYFQQPVVVLVIIGYILLNLAYTFSLKQRPVVDLFSIAIGFVLRVYAGSVVISVPLSSWMFITTLCLALYLAAIKRRQELRHHGEESRKVFKHYSLPLLNRFAEMSATGALVFYSLFVITERPELVITIPVVLFGLFRYWFLVESSRIGESPTDALTSDWQLLSTVAVWVGLCAWALWPGLN
jgi:decaprenyl-phosphate phosphoribosyltransferase